MKSYLSYKNQIQGFKDVSETIKTEEKIAASLIHFLEQEVFNLNTYADNLNHVLARLSVFYKKNQSPFLQENYGPKKLIVLTGNKGLTGGLWHRIIATFLENRRQYKSVITIGTKGESYLKEESAPITKSFSNLEDIPEKETIENITRYIFNIFRQKNISKIDILYPRFISLSEQTANIVPFLPFKFISPKNMAKTKEKSTIRQKNEADGLPIFEPSKQKIFNYLLQKYIQVFFHKIVMETKLSEFSARTVAMEHASEKTKEFVQKAQLNYTKQRRRVVTQKQLESFTAHKVA